MTMMGKNVISELLDFFAAAASKGELDEASLDTENFVSHSQDL